MVEPAHQFWPNDAGATPERFTNEEPGGVGGERHVVVADQEKSSARYHFGDQVCGGPKPDCGLVPANKCAGNNVGYPCLEWF